MTTVVTERRSAGHSLLSSSVLLPPRQWSARDGSAAILYDKLYIFGGYDTYYRADAATYDPATSAWSTLAPLAASRRNVPRRGDGRLRQQGADASRQFASRARAVRSVRCDDETHTLVTPPLPSPARFALHASQKNKNRGECASIRLTYCPAPCFLGRFGSLSSIWIRFWI